MLRLRGPPPRGHVCRHGVPAHGRRGEAGCAVAGHSAPDRHPPRWPRQFGRRSQRAQGNGGLNVTDDESVHPPRGGSRTRRERLSGLPCTAGRNPAGSKCGPGTWMRRLSISTYRPSRRSRAKCCSLAWARSIPSGRRSRRPSDTNRAGGYQIDLEELLRDLRARDELSRRFSLTGRKSRTPPHGVRRSA